MQKQKEPGEPGTRAPTPKRKGISPRLRFEVFKRDGFRCVYCGVRGHASELVVDHVHPVKHGGPTSASNLATSCVLCNTGKGGITLSDRQNIPGPCIVMAWCPHHDHVWTDWTEDERPVTVFARRALHIWTCPVLSCTNFVLGSGDGERWYPKPWQRLSMFCEAGTKIPKQDGRRTLGDRWEFIAALIPKPWPSSAIETDLNHYDWAAMDMEEIPRFSDRWGRSEPAVERIVGWGIWQHQDHGL